MYQHAQEFLHSPLSVPANSQGDMPAEFSFLELHPNNLILSALKKAEDSNDVILRFFETEGISTRAEIKMFRKIKRAAIIDLLEREEKELYTYGSSLELEVKPFEIVTLKLKL
jgi:alpha-mannosidase